MLIARKTATQTKQATKATIGRWCTVAKQKDALKGICGSAYHQTLWAELISKKTVDMNSTFMKLYVI